MKNKVNETKQKNTPAYQNRGLAVGIALGLIFGLMMDQIAVGLVLGIAVGLGVGRTLELQAQKENKAQDEE